MDGGVTERFLRLVDEAPSGRVRRQGGFHRVVVVVGGRRWRDDRRPRPRRRRRRRRPVVVVVVVILLRRGASSAGPGETEVGVRIISHDVDLLDEDEKYLHCGTRDMAPLRRGADEMLTCSRRMDRFKLYHSQSHFHTERLVLEARPATVLLL
jgi:hypothetical protein